ncbi:REV3 [Candida margitis]|uniref:REV3 n=1 Tax=Candida margitis TaxID=1775924 RepID=UPI0022272C64|nr:REV3 [Candida margitis]KAI5950599.1 REV3 [Candida margitis]
MNNGDHNSSTFDAAFNVSSVNWSTHSNSASHLKVQINDYDTYQAHPTKLDQLYTQVSQVPIIRIYGSISFEDKVVSRNSSPMKKKQKNLLNPGLQTRPQPSVFNAVIHVHNFYPYFYIDCHENDYEKLQSPEYLDKITKYLEVVVKESFKRRRGRKGTGEQELEPEVEKEEEEADNKDSNVQEKSSLRKYIAHVSVCKAVPIYGFQLGYKLFFKISLLSPLYKNRLAHMFQENKISLHKFDQPSETKKSDIEPTYVYEAHLPYLLQFLTDFNLFGCGWLVIHRDHVNNGPQTKGLYFRTPILSEHYNNGYSQSQICGLSNYLQSYILPDNVLVDGGTLQTFKRIGKSMLELDITTSSIVNRTWLSARELHDSFVERKQFDEYKSDLSSFGYPRHGYKHEPDGTPKIYLSSLKYIYNDLKYQCHLRNSTFDVSADVLESYEGYYFGTGSSIWSNQQQLDELLAYMKQLNGKSNQGFDDYAAKFFNNKRIHNASNSKVFTNFPTSFNLVDLEKSAQFHTMRMQFGRDILIWGEFKDLFKNAVASSSFDKSRAKNNDLIVPDEEFNGKYSVGERGEEGLRVERTQSAVNEAEIDDFSSFDSELSDGDKDANEAESLENKDDYELNASASTSPVKKININHCDSSPGKEDMVDDVDAFDSAEELDQSIIRSMTQSRAKIHPNSTSKLPNVEEISSVEDFSFTPTPSQSKITPSLKNMQVGANEFEVVIPDQLKKGNYKKVFQDSGIMEINYTDPFYNTVEDVPSKPFIFANQKMNVTVRNASTIPSLDVVNVPRIEGRKKLTGKRVTTWQYMPDPPCKESIVDWLKVEENKQNKKRLKYRSQIEPGVTQTHDFKFSYNSEKVSRKPDEFNYLSSFHLEIHASPPNSKLAVDPLRDPISFIFYSFDDANEMFAQSGTKSGVLVFNNHNYNIEFFNSLSKSLGLYIELFDEERKMVEKLVELVETYDPDILSGYEVNSMSWGYIVERFREVYEVNIMSSLSRGTHRSNGKLGDRWGYTHTSNVEITGRHILNVWRILKSDLALTSYTLENVCYHLLHRSLPRYSLHQISQWLESGKFRDVQVALLYYMRRIDLTLKIVSVQELITRNVEHSRLIGIEFNSNFYRGSQYKVESILSRISKTESILLNSPSKRQVHEMRPIECIPLILEPKSNFYKSPLVVLDFQSLYPSIMIAYNYCYSTLIGKLHNFKPKKNNIGYLKNLNLPPGMVDLLMKDNAINVSPNGFAFVKSHVRKSILAKMLEEILNIRIKTKTVMKLFKDDAELTKLYNARQMALKLIANVTYGYTSATFSGRMPNSDIADAIVSTGRELLDKSIEIIESSGYGAKVVYGDTDSLFVYFPGKSKAEAFNSGREIAKIVTNSFPDPVQLKFEKVYHPCVLLAKKRYVGYSFEYEDQAVPKFDAKGIETVRRDGVPAQQKITEKALRILFETKDLSKVKQYTLKQFLKIFSNKITINDFCFAKEVKYGKYKDERYLPPGALLASKAVEDDPRKEPQYKERVPYVVIRDSTKVRIKDRVMFPEDFIKTFSTTEPLTLDYDYYITRVLIPPLERVFNLMGADVRGWYRELPKFTRSNIISAFSDSCLICGCRLDGREYVCSKCGQDEQRLVTNVMMTCRNKQEKIVEIENTCRNCMQNVFASEAAASQYTDNCFNRDCSVYYNKVKVEQEARLLFVRRDKVLQALEW